MPDPRTDPALSGLGFRWLVRRAGLSADQHRVLDRLGLPERTDEAGASAPSHFMPPEAVGLIFTEKPDPSEMLGHRVFVTILTDSNAAPAEKPRAEEGAHP